MADAKKELLALARNTSCADCANPNPQWASVSFAIFLCLQCAGVHRGFGVHISFVRSLSMDTWQPDQLARMLLGGNAPFREFVQSYGYSNRDPHALYHSWAASQYREKLDCALAGTPWTPSSPPPDSATSVGLRKSRASKSANEDYLAALGDANAARPGDLPPSQGGRYQGFGNTPDNPTAPLNKGWSLFSAVVAGASRAVNDNVIQPAMDPSLHASVRGYVSEAQRRAQLASHSVNEWSKSQLGVDVNNFVGAVKDTVTPAPSASGYTSLASAHPQTPDDTNDLFHEYSDTTTGEAAKKKDNWDEWQDF